MNYDLENLDPERFQQFCQSLLVKEFPRLQCFPVGQRDGGRDAISYLKGESSTEFIVFQVKFVRNPQKIDDVHKWLTNIIQDEAPKILKQIPKGAQEFYLLTNVQGTSYPHAGSIDKVQAILAANLPIPSFCWWRDDLNSRLDNAWDLKWVYPEIMSGVDMLHYIIQSRLSEDSERRTAAIRAYVREQYEIDREVRFKQIELQNQLLDLFIDIPVGLGTRFDTRKQARRHAHLLEEVSFDLPKSKANNEFGTQYFHRRRIQNVGAATMALHPLVQQEVPQFVLEGAPGQGKSTIVQYICQVHRMKILSETVAHSQIAKHHQSTGVRIPFKVDLRDFATWLNGQDPFSSTENLEPSDWHKSLEAFLAAQVRHHAGGLSFSISDLHAVARLSNIALILDGLDEVADIATRRAVVNEVMAGIRRIRESSSSLQTIITSRPAAFANSPGFPEDQFPHFELASITKDLIDEYANKWLDARRLSPRERSEVKGILREKLDEPHLRDLARNPMQLAILLSLIHTRGSSLPDKRTALYDSYVELFFNRESEKSLIVRQHRDLLVDIHQFLAWFLHAESERGNRRGSISSDRLQELLSDYLRSEHQDTKVATELFTGMVERVVALVSRVEGTYEFEVQPLREYFAARYLYQTAPYSPPGKEAKGTKPDRFDAIARNFYWLNVTRFFAGCYSKGELPSLADRLSELVEEDGFCYTNHPRTLAMILLSDWVFAQHPKSMKKAVSLVTDGLGLRYTLNGSQRHLESNMPWILPKNNGNDALVKRCIKLLKDFPPKDYAIEIIRLLRANSKSSELSETWYEYALTTNGLTINKWLQYGLWLGILPKLDANKLESLSVNVQNEDEFYKLLFNARRIDFFQKSEERSLRIIDLILDGTVRVHIEWRANTILEQFVQILDPMRYAIAFHSRNPTPLSEYREMRFLHYDLFEEFETYTSEHELDANQNAFFPVIEKCKLVITNAKEQSKKSGLEWATSLDPWNEIVETSRGIWGERWSHFELATVASGIKSHDETYPDYSSLFDKSTPLCRRARYARLRAGNPTWWEEQLNSVENDLDKMFYVTMLLTWGSQNTIIKLSEPVNSILTSMTEHNWQLVARSLRDAVNMARIDTGTKLKVRDLPENLSSRLVAALALRIDSKRITDLYKKYLSNYEGHDPVILEICQKSAMKLFLQEKNSSWRTHLEVIRRSYEADIFEVDIEAHFLVRRMEHVFLPLEAAKMISKEPHKYPNYLTTIAEAFWRKEVSEKIKPVGQTAIEEGWFNL